MSNSYARGLVFRRLSEISKMDINSNTVDIISVKASTNKAGNTEIALKAKRDSFFTGTKVYYYNRGFMPEPISELIIPTGDRKIAWSTELLDLLYQYTGVKHLKEEIVNERINGVGRVRIRFSPNHPFWLGGFDVTLVKKVVVPQVAVNNLTTAKVPATKLYDIYDFTDYLANIKTLKVGQTLPEGFRAILESKRKMGWVNQQKPSAFNLAGAKVIYNGPASKVAMAARKNMRLLQISLDSTKCLLAYGEIMLYY